MKIKQCKTCGYLHPKNKWISPEEFFFEIPEEDIGKIEFEDKQCKRCEVISANYFEGTFQLRNTDSESFNKAIEFINDFMAIQEEKERGFITKPMQNSKGIDLLISSRKVLVQLGKAVYEEFGGETKVSKKLFSKNKQTSREVWRLTVLVRLPDVNIRDVIIDEDKKDFYQVKKYTKDSIITENLKTLKKKIIKAKEVRKLKIERTFYKTMVSKYKPDIEILEPFEFQSVEIVNQEKAKATIKETMKKKIRVFQYEGFWYAAD